MPKSSFVLRCLYYSANAPMLAAVQNSFWILELLPILWNFFSKIRVAQKKTAMRRSFLRRQKLLLFFYIVLKEQVEEYEQGAGNCGFNPEYCRPIGDCFCASLYGKGSVAVD